MPKWKPIANAKKKNKKKAYRALMRIIGSKITYGILYDSLFNKIGHWKTAAISEKESSFVKAQDIQLKRQPLLFSCSYK